MHHLASDQFLDAHDNGSGAGLLDLDTMMGPPMIGCFVCEEPYSAAARRSRCAGEPAVSVKRGER